MNTEEIIKELSELENLYAELLGTDDEKELLRQIHNQIKELREKLK